MLCFFPPAPILYTRHLPHRPLPPQSERRNIEASLNASITVSPSPAQTDLPWGSRCISCREFILFAFHVIDAVFRQARPIIGAYRNDLRITILKPPAYRRPSPHSYIHARSRRNANIGHVHLQDRNQPGMFEDGNEPDSCRTKKNR